MVDFNYLERLLAVNYAALGFELVKYETLPGAAFGAYDRSALVADQTMVRYLFRCPCGGMECASMIFDTEETNLSPREMTESVAENLLLGTASRWHLQADVDNGTLPAFDIDAHVFTKLIRPEGA